MLFAFQNLVRVPADISRLKSCLTLYIDYVVRPRVLQNGYRSSVNRAFYKGGNLVEERRQGPQAKHSIVDHYAERAEKFKAKLEEAVKEKSKAVEKLTVV